jgi:hypothetical protein
MKINGNINNNGQWWRHQLAKLKWQAAKALENISASWPRQPILAKSAAISALKSAA